MTNIKATQTKQNYTPLGNPYMHLHRCMFNQLKIALERGTEVQSWALRHTIALPKGVLMAGQTSD